MNYTPSIFNDVIGPVMRGPSSSHSAAALRIGRMCRDLMDGKPARVRIRYDSRDALATTHLSQGSDMGLKGGLLGFEADDERLLNPERYLNEAGIRIDIEVAETGFNLPNLYLLELAGNVEKLELAAISRGGGMVELIRLNGSELSICGDFHEILVFSWDREFLSSLDKTEGRTGQVIVHYGKNPFVELKSLRAPDQKWIRELKRHPSVESVRTISPVLPVPTPVKMKIPFDSCSEMLKFNEKRGLEAWELAVTYESGRGEISGREVAGRMGDLYDVMRNSVNTGMKGTSYEDRILGPQSVGYGKIRNEGKLAGGDTIHNITMYVSAIMETKSSMGTIVAAPTAGSCGTFPGAVMGVADSMGSGRREIVRAMLAGGLVGLFIAKGSTFSAEIGGCQAECGSAGGMAAASIAALLGGTPEQCMAAASMALQNSLGMICDPIAARVEAPCLGKNVNAATNALASANMAIAGYDHLIPLDEVIETMDRVGRSIPRELKCTALGGLSVTPSAKELEKKINP